MTCSDRCSDELHSIKQKAWLAIPENKERVINLRKAKGLEYFSQQTRERRSKQAKTISPATQRFFLSLKLGESVQQKNSENMKTKTEIVMKSPTVHQWIKTFTDKLKGIEDSCRELASMVDTDPAVFDKIVAADPRFNYNMLESMRKVGKGELYCELLFDPSVAARKLLALPPAQQKQLYTAPTPIVKIDGSKKIVEHKLFTKMSRAQQNQVIDSDTGHVRTVEEQIAYVAPPAPAKRAERYQIFGNRLRVLAETEFTTDQLRGILERMEADGIKTLESTMKGAQLKPR